MTKRSRRTQRQAFSRKRKQLRESTRRQAARERERQEARLAAHGFDPQRDREADRLERRLKDMQAADARRLANADQAQAEREAETYERLSPDDSRYRPSNGDPLATGAARATGDTARVARSGKTITKWQHDERAAR